MQIFDEFPITIRVGGTKLYLILADARISFITIRKALHIPPPATQCAEMYGIS